MTTGASIRPGPCVPGDLADSQFGPHLGSAVIRVDSGEYFHFGVAENHYDSCRELSWIILDGQIGDRAGTSIRPPAPSSSSTARSWRTSTGHASTWASSRCARAATTARSSPGAMSRNRTIPRRRWR